MKPEASAPPQRTKRRAASDSREAATTKTRYQATDEVEMRFEEGVRRATIFVLPCRVEDRDLQGWGRSQWSLATLHETIDATAAPLSWASSRWGVPQVVFSIRSRTRTPGRKLHHPRR